MMGNRQGTVLQILALAWITLGASQAIATQKGRPLFVPTGHTFGAFNTSGALADLDGDGDLDAFLGAYVAPATAWMNDGTGEFVGNGQTLDLVLGREVLIGDFDANPGLDAFVLSHFEGTNLWQNDGAGQFGGGPQTLGSANSRGAAAGDLDNDGDLDLFLTAANGSINAAAFNDGTGRFTYGSNGPGIAGRSVALGDVDGDGDLDALIGQTTANSSAPDRILRNDGHGVFTDSGQALGDHFAEKVALVDLDGDGDLDAFVANSGTYNTDRNNTVWFNDGDGTFVDSGQTIGDSKTIDMQLGDVDLDGDIDAIVLNDGGPDRIWFNDGDGIFGDSQIFPVDTSSAQKIMFGDIDGDGDGDIIVLSFSGNYVLENKLRRFPIADIAESTVTEFGPRPLNVPEPHIGVWLIALAWAPHSLRRIRRDACRVLTV